MTREQIKKETQIKGRSTESKHKKYVLLDDSLRAIKEDVINLLILKGSAGWGKSFRTKEYLEENNINSKYINTYSTPLAFYKILYENRHRKIIVFDDLQIEDRKIISILKGACNNLMKDRTIQWNSTTEVLEKFGLPDEFEFKANVILIMNENIKGFKPILNRAVIINFNFSFDEKITILNSLKDKAKLDEEILKFVAVNCITCSKNLSIRSVVNLSNLKKNGFLWTRFAKEMFEIDENKVLLNHLLQNCKHIKNACAKWVKQTGLSERTFYNYYKLMKGGLN